MTAFHYQRTACSTPRTCRSRASPRRYGTPAYVYSAAALSDALSATSPPRLRGLPVTICYALKANSNQAVIATFARLGAGADVVSAGELRRALAAGVPPKKIVFAGVGKTEAEMAAGARRGILPVQRRIGARAARALGASRGARAAAPRCALRVNPDVDAQTHAKITTGKSENKFGIELVQAPTRSPARRAPARHRAAGCRRAYRLAAHVHRRRSAPPSRALPNWRASCAGAGIALKRLDFGGGLGIVLRQRDAAPISAPMPRPCATRCAALDLDLILEPGRYLRRRCRHPAGARHLHEGRHRPSAS